MNRSIWIPKKLALAAFLWVLLLVLHACNLGVKPPATPSITPPATRINVTQLPQGTATLQASPTAKTLPSTPTPTRLATVSPTQSLSACGTSHASPTLPSGAFSTYPQSILDYLDKGGTPESLDQALYSVGVSNQPISVATGDLTGDKKVDVVVSIFDPASQITPPAGMLLIYVCSDGQYSLAYEQESANGEGAPGIRYLQDLDADGKADLVTSTATCGASTCFEAVEILEWNDSTFENRLQGTTIDLPYPDIRISGPDGAGLYQLEVTGSGYGSVGAGPPRGVERIFSLDPSSMTWKPGTDILEPSNYRIHVLQDADAAARQADYVNALQLYGRVVHDTTLQDWVDPVKERADLAAYALYKTFVVYELQNQVDLAQSTFDELKSSFPEASAQYGYVQLAEAFQRGYGQGGISTGCAAAKTFADQNQAEILAPLGLGYGNQAFTAEDICPFK